MLHQSENPIGENLLFLKKDECVRAKSGFPFPETAAKEIGLAAVLFRMHRKLGVKCLCDKKYRTELVLQALLLSLYFVHWAYMMP